MVALPSAAPRTEELTPYVPTLHAAATAEIRSFLGIPGTADLEWRIEREQGSPAFGRLLLWLPSRDEPLLTLEVHDVGPGVRAWKTAGDLGFSYQPGGDRNDPLSDAEMRPFLGAMAKAFAKHAAEAGPDGALPRLRAALDAHWRFRETGDWMYRQITHERVDRPLAVGNLRLGFRCNQDCGFCWQARWWPEPPEEYFFTWLEEFAQAGIVRLVITGGEPTLHRGLPELIRRAARVHGMKVWLQTNAIRLARANYCKTLARNGLDGLFVSYHSHVPEVSDRMTRAPGTHPGTLRGIEGALAVGLKVHLNCVVEQANYALLPDYAERIVERFVLPFPRNPLRRIQLSHPCSYYEPDLWERAVAPVDLVAPALVRALQTFRQAGVSFVAVGTCGFPPCLFREDPSLVRWLRRGDQDDHDISGRFFPEACDDCAVKSHCLGVRREYHEVHGARGIVAYGRAPRELESHRADEGDLGIGGI